MSPPLSLSPPGSSASHYQGIHTPSRGMSTSFITPVSNLSSLGQVSPPFTGWQQGLASDKSYTETPLTVVNPLPQVFAPNFTTGQDFDLKDPTAGDKQSGRVPPTRISRPRLGKTGVSQRRVKREYSGESDDDLDERPNTLSFAAECVAALHSHS